MSKKGLVRLDVVHAGLPVADVKQGFKGVIVDVWWNRRTGLEFSVQPEKKNSRLCWYGEAVGKNCASMADLRSIEPEFKPLTKEESARHKVELKRLLPNGGTVKDLLAAVMKEEGVQ